MHFLDPRKGHHPYEKRNGKRPNIFVFTVDMVPPEFHREPSPCLNAMQLPALASLRADSVDCRNAFSVSPLCGPSRASLFTGRYPYIFVNEERAHDGMEVSLRPEDPIYPEYLKAVGYLVGHVGKSHIGTEAFMRTFGESCSPWNRWAPPIYDDPEYHQYLADLGVNGFLFQHRIEGLRMDRQTTGNFYGGWVQQETGEPFPIQATYPHYLVQRALSLLESLNHRAEPGHPLYLHVDLFAPHQPFMIPSGMADREAALRARTSLPEGYLKALGNDFQSLGPEPHIYSLYRRNWGLYQPETAWDYQIANMLQMEVIDRALAVFLDRLKSLGLYEDSLVVFTADHGEMNLEGGLIDKGVYGHPKAARIPLIVKLPGSPAAGTSVAAEVSLIDLAPTFLNLAGVSPCARFDGEDLLPILQGGRAERDTPLIFEAGWHIAPNPAVAIQAHTDRGYFRYVYNASSEVDELYDLADPAFRNRIADEEVADVRIHLRCLLAEQFNSDPRWRCYRQCFELDRSDDLPSRGGDAQMFVPE